MPLSSIRTMLYEGGPERSREIARQLDRVRAQRRELLATEEFLEHVVTCTHSVLTKCTDCSAYAGRERVGEFGR